MSLRLQSIVVYDAIYNLLACFGYGVGRMPVRMTQGSDTFYFAYDQVGSLRAVFDDAGTLIHEITYDSYGNIESETTTQGFESVYIPPFGFAGGLQDRDTGLVLFGFRDYDPETGTWMTPDPIGFASGDTYLYAYCGGDPINRTDWQGLAFMHIGTGPLPPHVYIIIDSDGDGTGMRYEFGPDRGESSIWGQLLSIFTFEGIPGRVYTTPNSKPGPLSMKYKISMSDAETITRYWDNLINSPPNYSLFSYPCIEPVMASYYMAFPPTQPTKTMMDHPSLDDIYSSGATCLL